MTVAARASATAPAVPPAGKPAMITSVAWVPNHELNQLEWARAGRFLGAMARCGQWGLGDWIRYGEARFGERYLRAAKITGYDVQTLRNMVYVASRFEVSRRRDDLSWSHHEAVASLEQHQQDTWLAFAAERRLSVIDLRGELRTRRRVAGTGALLERPQAGDLGTPTYKERSEEAPQSLTVLPCLTFKCPQCGAEVTPPSDNLA